MFEEAHCDEYGIVNQLDGLLQPTNPSVRFNHD